MNLTNRRGARCLQLAAILSVLTVPVSGSVVPAPVGGLSFHYYKVVDTDTVMPGDTETFGCVGQPHVSYGSVAFRGGGEEDCGAAIWTWRLDDPATLTKRYGRGMSSLDGGTFIEFSSLSYNKGHVAFAAQTGGSAARGIYTDARGALELVANRFTPVPGGVGDVFFHFGAPWIYEGEVVFRARVVTLSPINIIDGIYAWADGVLRLVAAEGITPVPGGTGTFVDFGDEDATGVIAHLSGIPAVDDGVVVFRGRGSDGEHGVYREHNGVFSVIADLNTPIPGGTGNFTDFEAGRLAGNIDDDQIVFVGSGAGGQQGMYLWNAGTLSVIVDNTTYAGAGTQGMGFDHGAVAFLASPAGGGNQGIFTTLGGEVTKVVENFELLDGVQVGAFGTYGHGLSRNVVAMNVGFYGAPGEHANYVAVAYRAVPIDVRPKTINSKSQGVIPVAILSTPIVNAPVDIVQSSLRFGRTGTEASLSHCTTSDADGDGLLDLLCHFWTQSAGFQTGDTLAKLTGRTTDDLPIEGSFAVIVR